MYKWLTALGTAFTLVVSSTASTALDVEKHFTRDLQPKSRASFRL